MSERLTEEQERRLRQYYTETPPPFGAIEQSLISALAEIDILRQERDDAKEVSARVWEAAFGSANEAPADWLEELRAMRAARAGLQPTTEPPREDGWYWWRFDEAGAWTVVRVGIINGEPRMYLSGHASNYKAEWGQWARAFPPSGGS